MIKIGLANALLYHKNKRLWTEFFTRLGFEVVVSPDTTRRILAAGLNNSVDESCLPAKIFMGHVLWLRDKCDYILIPRWENYGKNDRFCVKFNALFDIAKNTFASLDNTISLNQETNAPNTNRIINERGDSSNSHGIINERGDSSNSHGVINKVGLVSSSYGIINKVGLASNTHTSVSDGGDSFNSHTLVSDGGDSSNSHTLVSDGGDSFNSHTLVSGGGDSSNSHTLGGGGAFYNARLLSYNVDKTRGESEARGFLRMGRELGFGRRAILRAYKQAKRLQQLSDHYESLEQKKLLNSTSAPKVLLVGHPYNTRDQLIGAPITDYLKKLGATVIHADKLASPSSIRAAKELSPTLYWTQNKELIGEAMLEKNYVDGIMFITALPCGPDSLVNELALRRLKGKPMCSIVVDELTDLSGLHTRIESFVDILEFRAQKLG